MSEAVLNALAQRLVEMTLSKTRYDLWDLQWYTEGPFWRRTSMRYSREYKIIPDYEIADAKHGMTLENIVTESALHMETLKELKKTVSPKECQRADYLYEHMCHINLRSRMLLGEKVAFDQMTDGLYCLVAPNFDYKKFDAILDKLNQALPGTGSVQEKITSFRKRLVIPPDTLLNVIKISTQVFHDISVKKMHVTGNSMPRIRVRELPSKDMVFLSILFGYDYNHLEYERNFNLLYPWTVDKVVEYVGHEMEPGHLTYFEKRLQTMIDTCWPEMSIVSQFSSSNSFSEGSARHAIMMSFDNNLDKLVDFEKEVIFRNAGIDEKLTELMPLWHEYCELSGYGKLEASRKLWDEIWEEEDAAAFLEHYGFADQGEGVETVRKMATEDDGHYVAHDYARDVVRDYFNSVTDNVDEQWSLYEKMCCAHMSMRQIKEKTYCVDDGLIIAK